MQPIIELDPNHSPATWITLHSEHIGRHREECLMDALHEATRMAGLDNRALCLLDRLVHAEVGTMAQRIVAAFARLDHVLADNLTVKTVDGRVRVSIYAAGRSAYAGEDATGWIVAAECTGR